MKGPPTLNVFYVIFMIAGAPALVYQVVWQRVLSLYFGVDIYSTAVTLAAFMAGLGLGSMWGGRLADQSRSPARVYACVELALGACGAISLVVFSTAGQRLAGRPLEVVALASFGLLVLPTVLMGMTLPLMTKVLVTDQRIGASLAWLYGLNTLGAACGALISSYYLIGKLGLQGAALTAASTNILLGFAVWHLSGTGVSPHRETRPPSSNEPGHRAAPVTLIILLSAASGFIALGYELVWYRLLTILLHGTVYVFGTILFVFLCGIAIGSIASRRRIEQGSPLLRFGRMQLLMSTFVVVFFALLGRSSHLPGLYHLVAASFFTSFHPSLEFASGERSLLAVHSLLDTPTWSIAMLGVPTFAMGYGFPQLMRAAAQSVATAGTRIGQVYFANIVGSTLGSLLVGFVLLERLGSEYTLLALALLGLAVSLLASLPERGWTREASIAAVAFVSAVWVFPGRGQIIKALHLADFPMVDSTIHEDRTGVVALRTQRDIIAFSQERRVLNRTRLYIDGAAHGVGDDDRSEPVGDPGVGLALSRVPRPQRVLSIGLGDGVMCATALADAGVTELVIVELNAGLLEVLKQTQRGKLIASSPKVRLVIDDGRRWLWANPAEQFDIIMMFPLHAAHAYYGNLFSREFFELAARHLTQDGTLVARSVDLFSTPRTLAAVFPHLLRIDQFSYVASPSALRFDGQRLPFPPDEFGQRIEADRQSIEVHTQDAPLNLDFRPNSEYYLTYPYAWCLAGHLAPDRIYVEKDRARFKDLLSGDEKVPDTDLPDVAKFPSE